HDLVEQFGDSRSVLRRDLEQRIESELIEVDDRLLGSLVVGLVHGEQHGTPALAQLARDALVSRHQSFPAVDDQHQQVRAGDSALPLLDDEIAQRILARAVQAAGVEQIERGAAPLDVTRERVARGAGDRRDDGAAAAGDSVEKGRFAHIGAADERNSRGFTGHFRGVIKTSLSLSLDSVSITIYSIYKPSGDSKHDQG